MLPTCVNSALRSSPQHPAGSSNNSDKCDSIQRFWHGILRCITTAAYEIIFFIFQLFLDFWDLIEKWKKNLIDSHYNTNWNRVRIFWYCRICRNRLMFLHGAQEWLTLLSTVSVNSYLSYTQPFRHFTTGVELLIIALRFQVMKSSVLYRL